MRCATAIPFGTQKGDPAMPSVLNSLADTIVNFYYGHTYLTIGLAAVLVLLSLFRPKAMLKTAGIVVALAAAAYFFTLFIDMAGTGRSQKNEMIHKIE
jgi:hypothetical protein